MKLKVHIREVTKMGMRRRIKHSAKNEKQDSGYSGATIHTQFYPECKKNVVFAF